MAEVEYRTPTLADAAGMADVHIRSMREAYAGIVPTEILAKLSIAEWTGAWRGIIAAATHPIFVAALAGQIVGIIRTEDCDEALEPRPDGKIRQLYILKDFHRRGIGRRLMQLAAEGWLARGARTMSVGVLTENMESRSFYEAMGGRLALQGSFAWDGFHVGETIYVFDDLRRIARSATYRVPTPADAEAIARLHVACWREAYAEIVPIAILDDVDMADRTARWERHLGNPAAKVFLAEVAGEAVGFGHRSILEEPLVEGADGHLNSLYLLQRVHRRGIGRRLLGLVAADWLALGGRRLSVGVLTANRPAVAFYEALGACFVRPDTYHWHGHDLPESIYVFQNLEELARLA